MNKDLRVVVLMGGWSAEREVSLTSGRGVAAALRERGWANVTELDMDRDIARRLAELNPHVVFNALHGTPGEDGTVQGMMDLMGLKYTHSGLATSVIAIDKELTKLVLVPHGIRMPAGTVVESESLFRADPLPRPYVLKPVNEGSSVGVAIVTDNGNYGNPIGRDVPGPWDKFDQLLAEPFIKGRELTVAVLGNEPLAVTELKIDSGFYDYEHKYTDGRTVHECPADVPAEIAEAMMDMAVRAHALLGCKGASRSDFRWDDELGEAGLYLLEVNTQPGMTPLSLVPEQAKLKGIAYGTLVERLIEEALK
jgi:D-alanine-D-alanine ligase